MKIALTGSTGLLGRYLLKTQPRTDAPEGVVNYLHEIVCLNRSQLKDEQSIVFNLYKINPEIIIHCAANGDVDSVENNPSEAVKSDLLMTIHLKDYCERTGCKLVTISTNAVYDGFKAPYRSDSPRNPINMYGKIKSLADDIIIKSSCRWLIVRPIMMYGWPNAGQRGNWVTRLINNKETVYLASDAYTQPTYAEDVAFIIWDNIENIKEWNKVLMASSLDKMSIYEFGIAISARFALNKSLIMECKLDSFSRIAPRPIDTCFEDRDEGHIIISNVVEGLIKMANERSQKL